jgi:hypothetical protein
MSLHMRTIAISDRTPIWIATIKKTSGVLLMSNCKPRRQCRGRRIGVRRRRWRRASCRTSRAARRSTTTAAPATPSPACRVFVSLSEHRKTSPNRAHLDDVEQRVGPARVQRGAMRSPYLAPNTHTHTHTHTHTESRIGCKHTRNERRDKRRQRCAEPLKQTNGKHNK